MKKIHLILFSLILLTLLACIPVVHAAPTNNVTSVTIGLGEDLTIVYLTDLDGSYTNYRGEFKIAGRKADAVAMKMNGKVAFKCSGIAPQEMWSELEFKAYKKTTGTLVCGITRTFAQIAEQYLEVGGLNDKVYRLVTDLLYYGSASSKYKNTSENLSEATSLSHYGSSSSLANFTSNYNERVAKGVNITGSQSHIQLKGRSVWFDTQNRYYIKFAASDISKVRFSVTVNGTELNYITFKKGTDGYYYLYTEPIKAYYLLSPATIVGYYNDVEELRFQYSALIYNNDVKGSSSATAISKDLAYALCLYGYNAVKYYTVPGRDFYYDDFAQMTYDMDMDLLIPGTRATAYFTAQYRASGYKYGAEVIKAATVPTGCSMTNTDFNTNMYSLTFVGTDTYALTLKNSIMHSTGVSEMNLTGPGGTSFMGFKLEASTLDNIKFVASGATATTFRCVTPNSASVIKDCSFYVTGNYKALQIIGGGLYDVINIENSNIYADAKYTAASNGVWAMGGAQIDGLVADLTFENTSSTTSCDVSGVTTIMGANTSIKNSKISIKDPSRLVNVMGLYLNPAGSSNTLVVDNCEIVADSHYLMDLSGSPYGCIAQAVRTAFNNAEIKNSSFKGNHCGIQLNGGNAVTVSNCKAEGTSHGGIYVATPGSYATGNNIRLIDNIIRHIEHYGLASYDTLDSAYAGDNKASLYIGGSSSAKNITVKMDGCSLEGADLYSIVLRGHDGEQNNKLYMSNCVIESGYARIDNNTMRLYVGTNVPISVSDNVYFNDQLYSNYTAAGIVDNVVFFTSASYRN